MVKKLFILIFLVKCNLFNSLYDEKTILENEKGPIGNILMNFGKILEKQQ